MSIIRVNFIPEFYYGDDAVLLTLDGAGVEVFRTALTEAVEHGSSQLDHDGVVHVLHIQVGSADIDLDQSEVVWRFDPSIAREIDARLADSSERGGAGHHYVDIRTPAKTLVVSRGEYVEVVYPWSSPKSPDNG